MVVTKKTKRLNVTLKSIVLSILFIVVTFQATLFAINYYRSIWLPDSCESKTISFLRHVQAAQEDYYSRAGRYTDNLSDLTESSGLLILSDIKLAMVLFNDGEGYMCAARHIKGGRAVCITPYVGCGVTGTYEGAEPRVDIDGPLGLWNCLCSSQEEKSDRLYKLILE